MYLTTGGGGDLSHKKLYYSYSKKMFTRRVKPTRTIGVILYTQVDRKWSIKIYVSTGTQ